RSSRKLARNSFHGMMFYQARMEKKQGFLFRCVDIVMELFVMSASVSHAHSLLADHHPEAEHAVERADLFCRDAKRKERRLFRDLWSNEDALKNRIAASVIGGDYDWLTKGALALDLTPESFAAHNLTEKRSKEAVPEHQPVQV